MTEQIAEVQTETLEEPAGEMDLFAQAEALAGVEEPEFGNGPDIMDELNELVDPAAKEETTEKPAEEPAAQLSEEEVTAKVTELTEKAEKDGLSDEEVKFLEAQGYEVKSEEETEEGKEGGEATEEGTQEVDNSTPFDDFLQENAPDSEYTTKEEKFGAIKDWISKEVEQSKQLVQVFEDTPDLLNLTNYLIENPGTDLRAALLSLGEEFTEAPEAGDEGYEEFVIAQSKAKEQKKAQKEQVKQRQTNHQTSISEVQQYIKSNQLNEDQGTQLFGAIDQVIKNLSESKMTPEFIEMISNGLNFKKAVKAAEAKGELKGMNKSITVQKKRKQGDKLPVLPSGTSVEQGKADPMLKALQAASAPKDNW